MPSTEPNKPILTVQTEKPNHYTYLKEFRVEQCQQFLQHKCTQHRPYTCFHWHFMNQRRRRPLRKRTGLFNYSPDNYCLKYDETTGICPDGDECPFLHRTAGDTERRYHLRYYKTCMCTNDTDSRGICSKNGPHCAFAHGTIDLRNPVLDLTEIAAIEESNNEVTNGTNALDKEKNLTNEDPKWQDTNNVLCYYKTDACKRPPRLCRQGYACPQYHNTKDRRRSPKYFKYRSTPCPNVKHGDEWGEPANCDSGDDCPYCHTRTEQQFHPEIYKSTKCNDVQCAGYCPRGVFCAFAHLDHEMAIARELTTPLDLGASLSDILSKAMPQGLKSDVSTAEPENGANVDSIECTSTSSLGSNCSINRAPGSNISSHHFINNNSVQNSLHTSSTNGMTSTILNNARNRFLSTGSNESTNQNSLFSNDNTANVDNEKGNMLDIIDGEDEKLKENSNFYLQFGSVNPQSCANLLSTQQFENSIGHAIDELHLDDQVKYNSIQKDFETDSSISVHLMRSSLLNGSTPVNIPTRENYVNGFSSNNSSIFCTPNNHDSIETVSILNQIGSNQMNGVASNCNNRIGNFSSTSAVYDYGLQSENNALTNSSLILSNASLKNCISSNAATTYADITKVRDDWTSKVPYSEQEVDHEAVDRVKRELRQVKQERQEISVKYKDLDDKYKVKDELCNESLLLVKQLKKEIELLKKPYIEALCTTADLRSLSLASLKAFQTRLKCDLEQLDREIYEQQALKCIVCEEKLRSVTLPCNHFVVCTICSQTESTCPYCGHPVNNSLAEQSENIVEV